MDILAVPIPAPLEAALSPPGKSFDTADIIAVLREFEGLSLVPSWTAVELWVRSARQVMEGVIQAALPSRGTVRRVEAIDATVELPALDLKTMAMLGALGVLLSQLCLLGQLEPEGDEGANIKRFIRCKLSMPKGLDITPKNVFAAALSTGPLRDPANEPDPAAVSRRCSLILDAAESLLVACESLLLDEGFANNVLPSVLLGLHQIHLWQRRKQCSRSDHITNGASLMDRCRVTISTKTLLGSLLQIVWDQAFSEVVLVAPGMAVPNKSSDPVPTQGCFRQLAGVEISRYLCNNSNAVLPLFEAAFASADAEDPASLETAIQAIAFILSKPAVEQVTTEAYLLQIAPQLRGILNLRGGNAALLRETAVRCLAGILAEKQFCVRPKLPATQAFYPHKANDEHWLLYAAILEPMVQPFLQMNADLKGTIEARPVLADDLMSAVENLHALTTAAPLPARILLRLLPVCLPITELLCFCRGNALRAAVSAACSETLGAILRGLPPEWTVFVLLSATHDSGLTEGYRLAWREWLSANGKGSVEVPPPLPAISSVWKPMAEGDQSIGIGKASCGPSEFEKTAPVEAAQDAGGILADLTSIGRRLGLSTGGSTTSGSGSSAPLGELGAQNVVGFSLETRLNVVVMVCEHLNGSQTTTMTSNHFDYRTACFRCGSGCEAMFAYLLARYVSQRGMDRLSNADATAIGLLLVLCERVGPGALRSGLIALQAIRSILHMCVSACNMAIPLGPSYIQNPVAIIIHERACEFVSDPGHVTNASGGPQMTEVLATCLGLLSAFAVSPPEAKSAEERLKWLWLHSSLPLLAALSDYAEDEIKEMSFTLRGYILSHPVAEEATLALETPPPVHQTTENSSLVYFKEGFDLLMDASPALQCAGLRRLAQGIRRAREDWLIDPCISGISPAARGILEVAVNQLGNSDTPIVLAAVEVLAAFLQTFSRQMLPVVLKQYSSDSLSYRCRVKIGEALHRCVLTLGEAGVIQRCAAPLLGICMKLGIGRTGKQMAPEESEGVDSDAIAADANDLQASALVLLGDCAAFMYEVCWSSSADILGALVGVLRFEGMDWAAGKRDPRKAGVEHAAAYALRRIAEGMERHQRAGSKMVLPAGLVPVASACAALPLDKLDHVSQQHVSAAIGALQRIVLQASAPHNEIELGSRSLGVTKLTMRPIRTPSAAAVSLRESGSVLGGLEPSSALPDATITPWRTEIS